MGEYNKRTIAFLDILGFTKHIERSVVDPNHLSKLFFAVHWLKEQQTYNSEQHIKDIGRLITHFSDCLVVSYGEDRMDMILLDIIRIQRDLAGFGLLTRGGITFGDIYHHKDGIVFGPAMIEAYTLESKEAKQPRVIISHSYYDLLISRSSRETKELLNHILWQDEDGFYFTNFLFPDEFYTGIISTLKDVLNKLQREIDFTFAASEDEKVKIKMEWMLSYIDKVKETYPSLSNAT